MSKYDEASALTALGKKGVKVNLMNVGHPILGIPMDSTNFGIGSWGKVDFLCHYCGYSWTYVKGTGKVSTNLNKDVDKVRKNNSKRERKARELTDKTKKRNNKK